MPMMRKVTTSMLALIALAACGRKGARSADFDSATAAALTTGAAAAQMANIPKVAHIAAVTLGHGLDRHNMVFGGPADQFKAGDSILAAAKGLYLVAGADVSARIRLKNATLDSTTAKAEAADSTGSSYVGLRFLSGKKWAKGTYSLEVFLAGKFQMSQEFSLSQ